jgi:hypothetical protein
LDKANGEIQADETRSVSVWLQAGIEVGRILVNHEREQQETLCSLKTPPKCGNESMARIDDFWLKVCITLSSSAFWSEAEKCQVQRFVRPFLFIAISRNDTSMVFPRILLSNSCTLCILI